MVAPSYYTPLGHDADQYNGPFAYCDPLCVSYCITRDIIEYYQVDPP